jgi:uncharacterized protein YfaS (alpha-2-macroglobulin family)
MLWLSDIMDKDNPQNKSENAWEIRYDGHVQTEPVMVLSENDLPHKTVTIKNTGQTPIWVRRSIKGINEGPYLSSSVDKASLKRTYFNANGDPIDINTLKHGDVMTVIVEGEIKEGSHRSLVYVDRLCAGFTPEEGGLIKENYAEKNPLLKGLSIPERADVTGDRVMISFTVDGKGTFKFAYKIRAITEGTFYTLPSYMVDMMDPAFKMWHSLGDGKTLDRLIIHGQGGL